MQRALQRFAPVLTLCLLATACTRSALPYTGHTSRRLVRMAPAERLQMQVFQTGRSFAFARTLYPGGKGKVELDHPAFLIVHPTYGAVLFDAGLHPDTAPNGREYYGLFLYGTGLMRLDQEPGQDIRSQLHKVGFTEDDIKTVVVSHFHPEHGGGAESFPNAGIAVDRRERAYLANPKWDYFDREWDAIDHWWELDFRGSQLFGPFEGYIDLAGDGTMMLLATPGHSPGHVSMLVRLPEGPVLLTGGMVWTEQNLKTGTVGPRMRQVDVRGARETLGRLLKFEEDHPEVLIVPGHDLSGLRAQNRKDIVIHPWPLPEPETRPGTEPEKPVATPSDDDSDENEGNDGDVEAALGKKPTEE